MELVPVIRGSMQCMSVTVKNSKVKGPELRYLVLDPLIGELVIFLSVKNFLENKTDKADVIRLTKICMASHGFNQDLARKHLNTIEITFPSDSVLLYLACYDQDQLKKWLTGI